MGVVERISREIRFLVPLARVMWRIRTIDPEGDFLICDDFEEAVDKFADHTAVMFEGERVTYRQLDAIANRFAAWAEAQGLKAGDTVALFLPNRTEYVAAWMGLAKRGVAAALINTNLTGSALSHCLSISNAQHVITDLSLIEAFDTIRVQLARPVTLWSLDGEAREGRRILSLHTPKLAPERPRRSVRTGIKARDTALYIFTSGTTGMPKAARITHVRAQLYMRAFAAATNANGEDRFYCALPLYHSTGGVGGVGAALFNGATLVLRRKFSATHFWNDMVAHGCTMFVYIGELCRYLVNQPPNPQERLHKLRFCIGNGLRPEVWPEFQERFSVPHILEFYGSTEGNVSLFNFDERPGAIGRVPPYLKQRFPVRLVQFDIESEMPLRGTDGLCFECAPGEVGEAIGQIGADARHEFAGYADKTASERKILRDALAPGDAWFRTGDLMRQDAEGYFYFVDRIGDTFRWHGENVSTTEVSEALARASGVAEAIVYGVNVNKLDGRAGMAAITPNADFDLVSLHAHVADQLPGYAAPIFLRLQPMAETTGTFKYRKMDLVQDGFDPARIEDALYFDHPVENRYVPLTVELYARIQAGEFKL